MTFKDETDPAVKAALDHVLALRRLTKQTGVRTYRNEREILESLSADVLAAVGSPPQQTTETDQGQRQ